MANKTITDLPNLPAVAASDQFAVRKGTLDYKMSVQQINDFVLGNITPSNTIVVRQESDFPPAVGGVITLAAGTVYKIEGQVTVTSRFQCSNGSSIISDESFANVLTYSGTGTMFTGTGLFAVIRSGLECPNGTLFNFSSPTSVLAFLDINANSIDTLGTINGIFRFIMSTSNMSNITTAGMTFLGNTQEIVLDLVSSLGFQAGTLFDFGTSTADWVSINTCDFNVAGGATLFSTGHADGNGILNLNGLATVTNNRITGAGTYLNNISRDDSQWIFQNNTGIEDTHPDSLCYISTGGLTTTIVAQDTGNGANAVKVNATWTDAGSSQFTCAAGRITYDGEKDITLPIDASLSLEPASGTGQVIAAWLVDEGGVVTGSKITATLDVNDPQNIKLVWQKTFSQNDWFEVHVANESSANDIIVQQGIKRVN